MDPISIGVTTLNVTQSLFGAKRTDQVPEIKTGDFTNAVVYEAASDPSFPVWGEIARASDWGTLPEKLMSSWCAFWYVSVYDENLFSGIGKLRDLYKAGKIPANTDVLDSLGYYQLNPDREGNSKIPAFQPSYSAETARKRAACYVVDPNTGAIKKAPVVAANGQIAALANTPALPILAIAGVGLAMVFWGKR